MRELGNCWIYLLQDHVPFLKTKKNHNLGFTAIDPILLYWQLAYYAKLYLETTTKHGNIAEMEGKQSFNCVPCRKAKAKRLVSRAPQIRAKEPG
jgi:hypothetical protein